MDDISTLVADAAQLIRSAEALLIGAGAGMGVDSGLPDFRGNAGFWKAYPPFQRLGLSFVKLANPFWFRNDPELAWGFYGHRRNLYRATQPHAGFAVLRKWASRLPAGCFVFTSNVDGHFEKAGFSAKQIVECHGSLEYLQCVSRCRPAIWPAPPEPIEIDATTFRALPPLPRCPHCGGLARPNVLMFGDGEWLADRTDEQYDRYQQWRRQVRNCRLVVVELGAGTAVPTVRLECESTEGTLIRINPRESASPRGGVSLPVAANEAIAKIDSLVDPTDGMTS
jgi:NAD-dependent SIR2 family protein deacetylase